MKPKCSVTLYMCSRRREEKSLLNLLFMHFYVFSWTSQTTQWQSCKGTVLSWSLSAPQLIADWSQLPSALPQASLTQARDQLVTSGPWGRMCIPDRLASGCWQLHSPFTVWVTHCSITKRLRWERRWRLPVSGPVRLQPKVLSIIWVNSPKVQDMPTSPVSHQALVEL